MILQTKNKQEQQHVSASIVQTRKRVSARFDAGSNELVAALAERMGPYQFDVRYEAAVWRGMMRATNLLRAPLIVIGVDDALKRMTIDEFGELIRRILEDSSLKELVTDGECADSIGSGFTSLLTSRLHPLSFRRIPVLMLMAKGHDRQPA